MKNIQAILVYSYVIVVIIVIGCVSFTILDPTHLEKGKLETAMWYGVPHVHEIVILSLERDLKTMVPLVCTWNFTS